MTSLLNRTEYILLSIFKALPSSSKTARLEMGSQEICTIPYAFISTENTPPPHQAIGVFFRCSFRALYIVKNKWAVSNKYKLAVTHRIDLGMNGLFFSVISLILGDGGCN